MADRADLEIPQGATDSANAEVSSDANTPEISLPMLDGHAPHELLHTWQVLTVSARAQARLEQSCAPVRL
jgi:hypothetical protein